MTRHGRRDEPEVVARATYDPGSQTSLVPIVVGAVAKARGEDPSDLPALHQVVEPDALDALVDGGHEELHVVFDFGGYEVVVRGDGEVLVHEPVAGF